MHSPKGTFDITTTRSADEKWRHIEVWQHIESILRTFFASFHFSEIRTPLFEDTQLFSRAVGASSDIVFKEMYSFLDKAERSLTLRPEGTAGVMRAFAQNHLDQLPLPQKLWYTGPFFRYERPQAGRYRQFHQVGAEIIGLESLNADVECVLMATTLLKKLGITSIKVAINCIGDSATRKKYAEALLAHFTPVQDKLSKESQQRLENNPLRILDSKEKIDQEFIETAPSIHDFLNQDSKQRFEEICSLLIRVGVSPVIDEKLVRGLDYYNDLVFEITAQTLGAQNTVIAGGRYDTLLGQISGIALPAVGFGMGFERLIHTFLHANPFFETDKSKCDIYIIPLLPEADALALQCATHLREIGKKVDIHWKNRKIQKALQAANAIKAPFALLIGEEELNNQMVQIKNLATRETTLVSLRELPTCFD